ncbi:HAD hydrolase-like protein [Bacillus ndiopicus]|uniref:HAD hydrolase-like protein n=1 Tax=Bacillus ndiopicus TaxID=1347368 RepID=UPI0005A83D3D|nr:HAD hydrolase-like protein [Bacillus ndiopicus]
MNNAIIFDMDGTLFQTNLILEPALEKTFAILREEKLWYGATPIEKYRNIMGVPLPVVWATLCPEHSLETRIQSNDIFHKQLIHQINDGQGALYDGVIETLSKLKDEYSLFIASNGQQEYLHTIVEKYQLARFIQKTYSIELIESGDKSQLIHLVKEENGIQNGFVVGDRLSDIKGAKDNRLTSISMRFDFAQEDELELADYVVDSFRDILDITIEEIF